MEKVLGYIIAGIIGVAGFVAFAIGLALLEGLALSVTWPYLTSVLPTSLAAQLPKEVGVVQAALALCSLHILGRNTFGRSSTKVENKSK
jgi:hypothetical protein